MFIWVGIFFRLLPGLYITKTDKRESKHYFQFASNPDKVLPYF